MAGSGVDILDARFERVLTDFKSQLVPMLKNNLVRTRQVVTGALQNSIDVVIHKTRDGWEVELKTLMYGKVLEKKETFAYYAPIEDLVTWIKQRGVNSFLYIPGYSSGRVPDDAAERIAWAMKRSENRYRFGNPGSTTTTYSNGSRTSRTKNAVNLSWLYKPTFGMWKEKRNAFIMEYYSTTSEELADMVQELGLEQYPTI